MKRGVVAAANRLAAEAGAEALRAGGSAVDGAIAAALTMGVVEPIDCGVAAGGFLLTWEARSGQASALDFMSTAPQSARYEFEGAFGQFLKDFHLKVKDRANEMGACAVAVPGALRGFEAAHRRWGRLPWSALFARPIAVAREGFPVGRYLAARIEENQDYIAPFATTRQLLLSNGGPRRHGEPMANPALAESLAVIAREGADALYTGALASALVAEMRRLDGFISAEDLAGYRVRWRTPVQGTLGGHTVYSMAPPSAGALIVLVLHALKGRLEPEALRAQTPAALDTVLRAMRAAALERAAHLGDPEFTAVPVDRWTDPRFAASFAEAAAPTERVAGRMPSSERETTSLSVIDREGNACSLTYSNMNFSGVTLPGTGIVLNNQMLLFHPLPGSANSLAPARRPASSMSPTIVVRGGRPVLALGASGGPRIPTAITWTILHHLVAGLPVAEAVSRWRSHWENGVVDIEQSLLARAGAALAERGWALQAMEDHHRLLALCQAAAAGEDGEVSGAGDPRGDGAVETE